jgi:hypothetical protein
MTTRLTPDDLAAWRRALPEDGEGKSFDSAVAQQRLLELMAEVELLWAERDRSRAEMLAQPLPCWRLVSLISVAEARPTRRVTAARCAGTPRRARSSPTCAPRRRRRAGDPENLASRARCTVAST